MTSSGLDTSSSSSISQNRSKPFNLSVVHQHLIPPSTAACSNKPSTFVVPCFIIFGYKSAPITTSMRLGLLKFGSASNLFFHICAFFFFCHIYAVLFLVGSVLCNLDNTRASVSATNSLINLGLISSLTLYFYFGNPGI